MELLAMILTSALMQISANLVSVPVPQSPAPLLTNATTLVCAMLPPALAPILKRLTELLAMTRTCALKPILAKLVFVLETTSLCATLWTNATKLVSANLPLANVLPQFQSMESLAMTTTFALKLMLAMMVYVKEAALLSVLLLTNVMK